MSKVFLLLIILFSAADAYADICPDLSGRFSCDFSNSPNQGLNVNKKVIFNQSFTAPNKYVFAEESPQGDISDNRTAIANGEIINLWITRVSYFCENSMLVTQWQDGDSIHETRSYQRVNEYGQLQVLDNEKVSIITCDRI